MYREWMRPQAYLDACGLNLTKDATQHAMLSVIRSEDRGWFTEEEFDRLSRLGPHFRRAILIGDLLERRTLLRDEMAATLDLLTRRCCPGRRERRSLSMPMPRRCASLMRARSVRRVGGSLSTQDPRRAKELQ